ncbi:hypothetical protein [uncultured Tateyamaria sp.]|uniref:hypothetical protein n=1 Tax=uncultured Tateyamaria sp. TaxID=455651 RepID=UPI002632A64A|nr:hypothetical protein [uncultured Tateyamaria sp.]
MTTDVNVVDYKKYKTLISEAIETEGALSDEANKTGTSEDDRDKLLALRKQISKRRQDMEDAVEVYMTSDAPEAASAQWRLRKTVEQANDARESIEDVATALAGAARVLNIIARFIDLVT